VQCGAYLDSSLLLWQGAHTALDNAPLVAFWSDRAGRGLCGIAMQGGMREWTLAACKVVH
jgi:hypothetical protein